MINEEEIENLSLSELARLENKKFIFGQPHKLDSSGEIVLTIAAPVVVNSSISAAVVAIVSLRELSQIMAETKPMSEAELWKAGLPIIFVVHEKGRAVFQPDSSIVSNQKPLTDLKIVQEW